MSFLVIAALLFTGFAVYPSVVVAALKLIDRITPGTCHFLGEACGRADDSSGWYIEGLRQQATDRTCLQQRRFS